MEQMLHSICHPERCTHLRDLGNIQEAVNVINQYNFITSMLASPDFSIGVPHFEMTNIGKGAIRALHNMCGCVVFRYKLLVVSYKLILCVSIS